MDAGAAGVVAMGYNVYVDTAARFTADVYTGLLAGQSLGAAVGAGRRRLAARPAGELGVPVQDWMVPVVYEAAPLHLVEHAARPGRALPRPRRMTAGLPPAPGVGFFGRDDTLLALDRAFGSQPIVLLHGEPGIGKTAAAAEFGRWYQRTGGVPGPVLYTSLRQHPTMAAVGGQLAAAFAAELAAQGLDWSELPDDQRGTVATQIMRQRPLLWIWDDLIPLPGSRSNAPASKGELLAFVRSACGTQAKMLLISRSDEQALLGDLPARVLLPPMPVSESSLLVRAAAARNGADLTGLGASSAALTAIGGNPRAILDLISRAVRAGCANSAELEAFVAQERG
jgi:hypothetical protein